MRAAYYERFCGPITVKTVTDPSAPDNGVVIRVQATGICLSDWHGWQGHDPDINLPHVPGHELAGDIVAVGQEVMNWQEGARVTLPFVCGCGNCYQCSTGNPQVCDYQFQPGFTHWGSFAEYVAIHYADVNLVRLPDKMDYVSAASLGCRFITSFRAVIDQGRIKEGEWLVVHGCGGVGLAAIMIGHAVGARVLAVDIADDKLVMAQDFGAVAVVNTRTEDKPIEAIRELTGCGAHVSIDAVGTAETCINSISGLRKQGRHVQVGLLSGEHYRPPLPMESVIANELEIVGSHGMPAADYQRIFAMIDSGLLTPGELVSRTVDLQTGVEILQNMNRFNNPGVTVINRI